MTTESHPLPEGHPLPLFAEALALPLVVCLVSSVPHQLVVCLFSVVLRVFLCSLSAVHIYIHIYTTYS